MPRLVAAHLVVSVAWLILGVGLGIAMAATHDHLLGPVHAHVNLLGWVTNALMGYFYWQARDTADSTAWVGFGCFNLGSVAMAACLTAVLHGTEGLESGLAFGAVLIATGVLIFAGGVVRAAWVPHRALRPMLAE